MIKYIAGVLIFIFGSLFYMYFFISESSVRKENFLRSDFKAHLAGNPEKSIENVEIIAVYFVPKNKKKDINDNWRAKIEKHLEKLSEFHSLQLKRSSHLSYKIYPEPVIGEKDNVYYDTEKTERGNPEALIKISEEIEDRFFSKGDFKNQSFSFDDKQKTRPVLLIVYEGVGASGGIISDTEAVVDGNSAAELSHQLFYKTKVVFVDGFILLNTKYLDDKGFGASILAHEFYHTLGVADNYQYLEEQGIARTLPKSDDLMGAGREKPIEKTYLSGNVLKEFGL